VQCLNNKNCSDSLFCNGEELCFNNECFAGAQPCAEDEICSEQTDVCVIPSPDECETSADCDDGVFCNGAEACEAGTCVQGDLPCADDQLCREAREQCWDLLTISSSTTFSPELGERTVARPLLLEQRCIWLRVMALSAHHFAAGKSKITLQRSGESFAGVTLDQTRTPVRGLLFENAVWLPVCISKDATVGRWEIRIETEVSDAETPFLETIQGFFVVQ